MTIIIFQLIFTLLFLIADYTNYRYIRIISTRGVRKNLETRFFQILVESSRGRTRSGIWINSKRRGANQWQRDSDSYKGKEKVGRYRSSITCLNDSRVSVSSKRERDSAILRVWSPGESKRDGDEEQEKERKGTRERDKHWEEEEEEEERILSRPCCPPVQHYYAFNQFPCLVK